MHVLILHFVPLLGQPNISSVISLPVERNSLWAVHNDSSIPFLWCFCDNSNLHNIDLNFSPHLHSWTCSFDFHFHCVVFSWKTKVLWYQNISQDYRDCIKTLRGNQVWQESWPDCRAPSQPCQQQHCQASELPCSSSQSFRLFYFLCGTACCQFHTSRLPSLSVPAAGWADSSLRDLHLMLHTGECWHCAQQHFTLWHVQQAMLQHQEPICPFSAISTVNCSQVSKRYSEVKEVVNNWPFEKSRSSAPLLYTSSAGGRLCQVDVLSLAGLGLEWKKKYFSGSLNHCLWYSW